ncbi:hypothetical protein AB0P17_15425 [Streptomyces sp. NPDC088124]|uniref:hypothetical protein n=1 Tax=Streptomyces sp. NPDC088124 TaxID=3154654 RepID=UPI0034124058
MSTTRTPRPATAQHLWTIARHWPDLAEALTTRTATWPPAMGIAALAHPADSEEAEAATWRAEALRLLERSPDQPGWTAAPLHLGVLDTIATVEGALIELADQTADAVQRPQTSPPPPRRATTRPGTAGAPGGFDFPAHATTVQARRVQEHEDRRRALAAMRDARDPRRWQLPASGQGAPQADWGRRTGDRAALWLLARVQHAPGPVRRRLNPLETARITTVAATAARMVERALDLGAERARIAVPCPHCGGTVTMYGGSGVAPGAHCAGCGRTW